MAVMTKKGTGSEELRRIGEAIDESILNASSAELREEAAAQGLDLDKVGAEMDAILANAKSACAQQRLARAKEAVVVFKSQTAVVSPFQREAARKKLHAIRSGDGTSAAGMMRAARKGKSVSEGDEQGEVDDLAQLEALESEEFGDNDE
jgi:hypothetical protein